MISKDRGKGGLQDIIFAEIAVDKLASMKDTSHRDENLSI